MDNEFEFIKGYENLYKINKNGEVFSCIYNKVMQPQETDDGFLFVNLRKEKSNKKCRIHRLIALQFIENIDNKPEVDHIDKNKKNNSIINLRWVTRKENAINKIINLTNLTNEKVEARKNNIKEYKKEWAEKDRRAKGIKPVTECNKTKDPQYIATWARNKRALETPEEKEERLKKRRELYALKEQTPEQKAKANERAKKQREKKVKTEEQIERELIKIRRIEEEKHLTPEEKLRKRRMEYYENQSTDQRDRATIKRWNREQKKRAIKEEAERENNIALNLELNV